ncbi:hypothetical protein WA026_014163 [Henosepilachna vigintioctopunctata]|uniref:RNase H type-1 domain-containing protein n=1 Tax=Henosepilachna vigintioctopunctata TaxID=420089 RepID=A0AAW1TUD4_9CUCU
MAAIMIALDFIKINKLCKCVILSDSKSALESICNWRMGTLNTEFGLRIRKLLYVLASHNVNVQLVWIPSHSNIKAVDGNGAWRDPGETRKSDDAIYSSRGKRGLIVRRSCYTARAFVEKRSRRIQVV